MQAAHRIEVREGTWVTALRTVPERPASDLVVVYAPGAGSNLHDPFGAYLASFLDTHGIECWRFQFPYSEADRKAPDPPALLEATWRAVIEAVVDPGLNPGATHALEPRGSSRGARIVIGGRSMGGRIASMVAAKGAPVDGLLLFAYPLIPPGASRATAARTSDRTDHFDTIKVPALFCSGNRDSFGTPEQLREATARVRDAELHILEGADHGFATLKASGRSREDVWREACEAALRFLHRLGDGNRG